MALRDILKRKVVKRMDINKLLAKPKTVELAGEKVDIYPLTVGDIDILMDLEKDEKRVQATFRLIEATLKKIDPNVTIDMVKSISLEYLDQLMTAIAEVNNLGDKIDINAFREAQSKNPARQKQ